MDYGNDSFGYDELCAMFDESSQCTIVLPEECLGYGLVVPFHACGFALWFRIMKSQSEPMFGASSPFGIMKTSPFVLASFRRRPLNNLR